MEVFFTFLLFASLIGNFILSKRIREIRAAQKISDSKQEDLKIYLTNIFDIVRSIPLPSQLPQSPIKPNNWDSIKEAFKGPTRIEVNERN